VVLHQRQPFEVVIDIRNVVEEVNRFALEDSENSLFLLWPCAWIDSEGDEVSRDGAEQRSRSVTLSAKCPMLIG